VLVALGPAISWSQDGDATSTSSEDTFSEILRTIRNLNAFASISGDEDYSVIEVLIRKISEDAADGRLSEASVEDIRELRELLINKRSEFLKTIEEAGSALSPEHRESILSLCDFDPTAEAYLEAELRRVARSQSDGISESTVRRLAAPSKQCSDALKLVAETLDAEIEQLEGEISALDERQKEIERRLQDEDLTDEERQELQSERAEIEQEREQKTRLLEDKKKVRGQIDVGLLLSGLVNMAVGLAITVYSGGTFWPVVGSALIKGGGAMVGKALEPLTKEEEVVTRREVPTGDYERAVDDDHQPTEEERSSTDAALREESYSNISPTDESGNFAVYRHDNDGSIKLVQIEPYKEIVDVPAGFPLTTPNDLDVTSLVDIKNMKVSSLTDVSTAIKIDFTGESSDGTALKGRLVENPTSPGFLLTLVDANE
ncbi:MAG: hypothetical protein AAGJ80_05860, partial [Cyanobacteria bacterium J06553_1]